MKLLLIHGEREIAAEIEPVGSGYAVTLDGRRVTAEGAVGAAMRLLLDGRPVDATARREGQDVVVDLRGRAYRFRTRDARAPKLTRRGAGSDVARGELHAPMPGLVVDILVQVGETVAAGAPMIVVEAMKMQNALVAPLGGRVAAIAVKPGVAVETGQLLITVAADVA